MVIYIYIATKMKPHSTIFVEVAWHGSSFETSSKIRAFLKSTCVLFRISILKLDRDSTFVSKRAMHNVLQNLHLTIFYCLTKFKSEMSEWSMKVDESNPHSFFDFEQFLTEIPCDEWGYRQARVPKQRSLRLWVYEIELKRNLAYVGLCAETLVGKLAGNLGNFAPRG